MSACGETRRGAATTARNYAAMQHSGVPIMRLIGRMVRAHTGASSNRKGQKMLLEYRSWMMIIGLFAGVLGCDEGVAESPDDSAAGRAGQAGTGDGGAGSGGASGGGAGGQGGSSAEGGMGGDGQGSGAPIDGSSGEGGEGGSDAGDFDAGAMGSVTFTSLYDDVFGPQAIGPGVGCASPYCHGGGSGVSETMVDGLPGSGFSVSTKQSAYDSLVDAEGSANCGGAIRVVPGDPDASLLVQKITDPPCGERMPMHSEESLSPEAIARIRAWIGAGARND